MYKKVKQNSQKLLRVLFYYTQKFSHDIINLLWEYSLDCLEQNKKTRFLL